MPIPPPSIDEEEKKKKEPWYRQKLIDNSAGKMGQPVVAGSDDDEDLKAVIARYNYANPTLEEAQQQSPAGAFGRSLAEGVGSTFMSMGQRAMGRGEEADTTLRINDARQAAAKTRDRDLSDALFGDGQNRIPYADTAVGWTRGAAQSGAQMAVGMPLGMGGMAAVFGMTTANDAYVEAKDRGLRGLPLLEAVGVQGGLEAGVMLAFSAAGRPGVEGVLANLGRRNVSDAVTNGYLRAARQFVKAYGQELPEELLTAGLQETAKQVGGQASEDMTAESLAEMAAQVAGETFMMTLGATAVSEGSQAFVPKRDATRTLDEIENAAQGEPASPSDPVQGPAAPTAADPSAAGPAAFPQDMQIELIDTILSDGKPRSVEEINKEIADRGYDPATFGEAMRHLGRQVGKGVVESTDDGKFYVAGEDAEASSEPIVDTESDDAPDPRPLIEIEAAEAEAQKQAEGGIVLDAEANMADYTRFLELSSQLMKASKADRPAIQAEIDRVKGEMDANASARVGAAKATLEQATEVVEEPVAETPAEVDLESLEPKQVEAMWREAFPDAPKRAPAKSEMIDQLRGVPDEVEPTLDPVAEAGTEIDPDSIPGDLGQFEEQPAPADMDSLNLKQDEIKSKLAGLDRKSPERKQLTEDLNDVREQKIAILEGRLEDKSLDQKQKQAAYDEMAGLYDDMKPESELPQADIDSITKMAEGVRKRQEREKAGLGKPAAPVEASVPEVRTTGDIEALPQFSVYRRAHLDGVGPFQVRGDGPRGGGDSIHSTLAEAQAEAERERTRAAERQAFKDKAAADEKAAADKDAETVDSYKGFLSGSPMSNGQARKALEVSIRFRGNVTTRKGMVESLVADGWTVQGEGKDKQLAGPDGAFFDARDVTATGLRYAEHLTAQAEPEPAKAPEPKPVSDEEMRRRILEEMAKEDSPPAPAPAEKPAATSGSLPGGVKATGKDQYKYGEVPIKKDGPIYTAQLTDTRQVSSRTLSGLVERVDAAGFKPDTVSAPEPAAKPKSKMGETKKAITEKKEQAADDFDAAMAKLREKLSGKLMSGIDPEILGAVADVLVAGVRHKAWSFAEIVAKVAEGFGSQNIPGLRPYLERGWRAVQSMEKVESPDYNAVFAEYEAKPSEGNDGKDGGQKPGDSDSSERGVPDGTGKPRADATEAQEEDGGKRDASGDARGEGGRVPERTGKRKKGDAERAGDQSDRAGAERDTDADQSELAGRKRRLSPNAKNHVIKAADDVAISKQGESLKRNIDAMRLLKQLEKEDRDATPEEKAALARFSGWGRMSQVFDQAKAREVERGSYYADQNWKKEWYEGYKTLKELLTPEEWDSAMDTTINAHYTSTEVIGPMWAAAKRLGFKGGRVVEPGAGIGHFVGMVPADIRDKTQFTLVEMDSMSSRMLKKLYPEAEVLQGDLNETSIKPGSAAMAIGNVPFASQIQPDSVPRYGINLNLHNYFIARALDAVEPGGMVAVISSNGTMDNAPDQRAFLATKGDFIAAIRLPNNAFQNNAKTEVTTDILFFRRPDGQPVDVKSFQSTDTIEVENKDGVKFPHQVNRYFLENPEMVLGKHSAQGKQYSPNDYALISTPGDLKAKLNRALANLPESIIREGALGDSGGMAQDVGTPAVKEGMIDMVDGKPAVMISGEWRPLGNGKKVEGYPTYLFGKTAEARAIDYMGIRNAYADLRTLMLSEDATDDQIAAAQKAMKGLHQAYVNKHGYLQESKSRIFKNDPEYYRVMSLENKRSWYDKETKKLLSEYTLADVFTKRTLGDKSIPTAADNVTDAVSISLGYRGRLDLDYMAELMGATNEDVVADLQKSGIAFRDPETLLMAMRADYLSGNVRSKLRAAEVAAKEDKAYEANVEALKAAQPDTVKLENTSFELGDDWIPAESVESFAKSVFKVGNADVTHNPATGMWEVSAYPTKAINEETGTSRVRGPAILQDLLNLKTTKVFDTVETGEYTESGRAKTKQVLNQKETVAARAAGQKMQRAFSTFVSNNPKVAAEMESRYNEARNSFVDPVFDGSHLTLPGSSPSVSLRPYQKNAIWRILHAGKALLAHAVGAGKTYTMIGAAMEMKRLGLAKRPMIVVQNATLGQFATSFMTMYPNAKVLVARKQDLEKANRQLFLSRVTSGNWDAVVVAQSSFDNLMVKPDVQKKFINDQLQKLTDAIAEEGGEKAKTQTVKDLVRARNALRKRLADAMGKQKSNEDTLFFDDLDVDALFLDEAHAYKKPFFITKLENLVGLNKIASARGMATQMKLQSIQAKNKGRNVVLATGTPITNTLGEAYHMTSLVDPALNAAFQMSTFDGFVGGFGRREPILAQNAGGKWVFKDSISKFKNGPELMRYLRASWDILTPENLRSFVNEAAKESGGKGIPEMRGGKVQAVTIPKTPQVDAFMKYLDQVYKKFLALPPKERRLMSYIPAVAYGAAKAASIDIRLVMPNAPREVGGKLDKAAENILSEYQQSDRIKGTQLVFSDVMNVRSMDTLNDFLANKEVELDMEEEGEEGDDDAKKEKKEKKEQEAQEALNTETQNFVFNQIIEKLVAGGVPRSEIAIVSDAKTDAQREALFARVKLGEIRVLFGSTGKMGVGVNVQDKVVALHHLDMPWQPADVEQREGRALRWGNQNSEVAIYRYAMKGTLDGAIFSSTVRKAKFIWQALAGKLEGREFDDPASEVTMSIEEQMAAIMDDPIVFEKMELNRDVRDLEMEKESFNDGIERARRSKQELQENLKHVNDYSIPGSEARLAEFEKMKAAGNFNEIQVEIDGKVVTGKKEVDTVIEKMKAKLVEHVTKVMKKDIDSLHTGRRISPLGSGMAQTQVTPEFKMGGMVLKMGATPATSTSGFVINTHVGIALPSAPTITLYDGTASTGTGIWNAITKLQDDLASYVDDHKKRKANIESEIDELDRRINESFWEGQEKLDTMKERLAEIEKEMADPNRVAPGTEPEAQIDLSDIVGETKSDTESPARGQSMPPKNELDAFIAPDLQNKQSMGSRRQVIRSAADMVSDPADSDVSGPSPYASNDEGFEGRWRKALLGLTKRSLYERFVDGLKSLKKNSTRGALPELPRTEMLGEARSLLRLFKDADQYGFYGAKTLLQRTVKPLRGHDIDLFARALVFRNLVNRTGAKPFGLTDDQVKSELERVEGLVKNNPRVEAALDYRREWFESMRRDYIEAHRGLGIDMESKFTNEDYFRHQVLEKYIAKEMKSAGGAGRKAQVAMNRGWLSRARGSDLDINANYLQAEWEVVTQMLTDTRRAWSLKQLNDEYGMLDTLKARAKAKNFEMMAGGKDVVKRINFLRAERARLKDGPDRKAVIKELSEIDPLYEYRKRIAIASSQLVKAEPFLAAVESEAFFTMAREISVDPKHRSQGFAKAFLAAINDQNAAIRNALGDKFLTWESIMPEDYSAVTTRPGKAMFAAYTIPEAFANELLEDHAKRLGISADDLQRATVVGKAYTPMVLPNEIAAQMENMSQPRGVGFTQDLDDGVVWTTRKWKGAVLLGPHRVVKYNLRNMSEIDKFLNLVPKAASPSMLMRSMKDLYVVFTNGENVNSDMRDWLELGGASTLQLTNDVFDLEADKQFKRFFANEKKLLSSPRALWGKYWSAAGAISNYRESILRYSAYLVYLEQIKKNGRPNNYGGSNMSEVLGIRDAKRQAFRLSADIAGDYGDISPLGQWLRDRVIPFWPFQGTNFRTYGNGLINLSRDQKNAGKAGMTIAKALGLTAITRSPYLAYRLGRVALLFGGFQAGLRAFNLFFFRDEEDELPEDVRKRPHIILPWRDKDGKVVYFDRLGTSSDILDWFGFDTIDSDLRSLIDGDKTIEEVAKDMAWSPVNKVVQGLTPAFKIPNALISGKDTFPDVREPRTVRDKGEYVAKAFGLDYEYRLLAGMPTRGLGDAVSRTFFYKSDGGEAAYYSALDDKFRWSEKNGGGGRGSFESPRSDALRSYKEAVRFGDKRAAEKYLTEYRAAGGDDKGMEKSIAALHPLSGLNMAREYRYLATLDEDGKAKLDKAEAHAYKNLMTPEQAEFVRKKRADRVKEAARIVVLSDDHPNPATNSDYKTALEEYKKDREEVAKWFEENRSLPSVRAALRDAVKSDRFKTIIEAKVPPLKVGQETGRQFQERQQAAREKAKDAMRWREMLSK